VPLLETDLIEAVPVTTPLVAQQFHARRQIQLHFDLDLSHPWPPWFAMSSAMVGRGGRIRRTAIAWAG
jgi:hypothetical protein